MVSAGGADSMNRVGLVRDPLYLMHSNGPWHDESPDRLRAIHAMLADFPRKEMLVDLTARDATIEELARVHEEPYIRALERTSGQPRVMIDIDTSTTEHSYAAAVRAAGGLLAAVEACLRGELAASFALVRPPGHHAESGRAMGFCLFNNVAVAAQFALQRLGLDRVLIVDWDVHHGNGTMHSFYDTDRVLFFSTHQYPHYPGTGRIQDTGAGPGRGFTVNVPLPAGQGDEDFAAVFERVLRPVALEYRPQLILVSAGFDIARGDPLGDMTVSPSGFSRLTEVVLSIAAECCPGRLAFSLEGGYDLRALAGGVDAVLATLVDGRAAAVQPGLSRVTPPGAAHHSSGPSAATRGVIDAVLEALRPFWKMPGRG